MLEMIRQSPSLTSDASKGWKVTRDAHVLAFPGHPVMVYGNNYWYGMLETIRQSPSLTSDASKGWKVTRDAHVLAFPGHSVMFYGNNFKRTTLNGPERPKHERV